MTTPEPFESTIVTSSELPELLTLCDRILVLCEGRLTGVRTKVSGTVFAFLGS